MAIKRMPIASALAAAGYLALAVWLAIWRSSFPATMGITDKPSPLQLKAIDLYFKKLESLGSLSLALTGALWAFVIYPKEEGVRVRDNWSWSLVVVATFYFVTSFAFYTHGYGFLTERMFFHDAFDLEAPIVSFWSTGQLAFFAGGVGSFVAIVLLCRESRKGSVPCVGP